MLHIVLDSRLPEPLHRQVYRGIRDAILTGRVPGGARLPSTRQLAGDLGVSRSTVLVAFDQLVAEGCIVGAVGSGSYAAREIPSALFRPSLEPQAANARTRAVPRFAARATQLERILPRASRTYPGAFWTGVPPVDEFPLALWARLASRRYRTLATSQLYHGSPGGYQPLRQAIAEYLIAARGVRCSPEQVIVLSSAQEAFELACRVLLDPGDAAWLEDPSWSGAHGALIAAGARIFHVPVDADGLVVEQGIAGEPHARLAYVSPSHQYPAGVTMSLERRLSLLDWAATQGAWILEDDYDSEYRYAGRPLTALQGLDTAGCVLYVGTFNKTLFPALRVGYLVVPAQLVDGFLTVRRVGAQHAPTVDQAVLTDFIAEGHYARHLRHVRKICRERRDVLVAAATRYLPGVLEITQTATGLHAIGRLPPGLDDVQVSAAAASQGVEAAPLSRFYAASCPRGGLVLGYGGLRPPEIDEGMRRLADALRTLPRGHRRLTRASVTCGGDDEDHAEQCDGR